MPSLHFYDREDRPWPNPRLTSASIVGHTTSSGTRLWVRAVEPGPYALLVSPEPIPTGGIPSVREGASRPEALVTFSDGSTRSIPSLLYPLALTFANDITAVVDVTGLQADTQYSYALFHTGGRAKPWELGYEEPLSFRTMPEDPREIRFGIYSCHMPYNGLNLVNMEMWDSLYQELTDANAHFIIGMGDQVYVDGNDKLNIWKWLRKIKGDNPTDADMVSWYRDIYRGYWGMLILRQVLRSFPTYMIWDDHEIMDGWGSYTDTELSDTLDTVWEYENVGQNLALAKRMFAAARKVYEEYQHSHNPPTASGQFDYSFACGPCGFYVLDSRGHRDYNKPDGERVLGREQMARFHAWLQSEINRQVLFVVSPVPLVHASSFIVNIADISILGLADDLRDEWEHESNWTERNTLLEAAFQWSHSQRRRVIFLSGDVHIGAAFKLHHRKYPGALVYQLTSSAITYALSGLGRRALQLVVNDRGSLGDRKNVPEADRYHFTLLQKFGGSNYAIVRVKAAPDGKTAVGYDLFGGTEDREGIIKLGRLVL
jgi:alkaline phosphatase D